MYIPAIFFSSLINKFPFLFFIKKEATKTLGFMSLTPLKYIC
nr:MAG TPA: hypothetical protein [Caudoviricetes sp.]